MRALLAEPRSPGNEETWERLKAKFPDDDDSVAVEEAIAEAIYTKCTFLVQYGDKERTSSWKDENKRNSV